MLFRSIREENDVEYYQGIYEDEKPYFYISKEPTTNTDLKLYKRFELGRLSYRLFLDIQNLWDQRIARRINPFTGNGYNPGEIIPYSMIDDPNPNYDPSRFLRPRTIELGLQIDRKSTRLNSSHKPISYAVFCLKKKKPPYYCFSCFCSLW